MCRKKEVSKVSWRTLERVRGERVDGDTAAEVKVTASKQASNRAGKQGQEQTRQGQGISKVARVYWIGIC